MSHKKTWIEKFTRIVATIQIGDATATMQTEWERDDGYYLERTYARLREQVEHRVRSHRTDWAKRNVPAVVTYRIETKTKTVVTYESTRAELRAVVTL